jgi:hypothetical protein
MPKGLTPTEFAVFVSKFKEKVDSVASMFLEKEHSHTDIETETAELLERTNLIYEDFKAFEPYMNHEIIYTHRGFNENAEPNIVWYPNTKGNISRIDLGNNKMSIQLYGVPTSISFAGKDILSVEKIDVKSITHLNNAFEGAQYCESISGIVKNKITSMDNAFIGANSLSNLSFASLDTISWDIDLSISGISTNDFPGFINSLPQATGNPTITLGGKLAALTDEQKQTILNKGYLLN